MQLFNLLSRSGIGLRIYVGFLLVVAAVVVVSALAYRSAEQARSNFEDLEQIRTRATTILELDRAVVTLQRSIENYTFTGHNSVARRVEENIARLSRDLKRVSTLVAGSAEQALLARMERHFDEYQQEFAKAATERQLRQKLVTETIVATRAEIAAAVAAVAARERKKPQLRVLQISILEAEKNLYRYLHDPQYSLLVDSKAALEASLREFSSPPDAPAADGSPEPPATSSPEPAATGSPERDRLIASVRRFESEFTRTVQATRAYLYIIGVVMAGQAHEFGHVSGQLRDLILRNVGPLTERIATATASEQRTATLASIFAVLAAVLISWLIARSISRPIADIAATLEQLAADEQDAAIPGIDRTDEIGVMAKAADVFKEKNQETRRLLERSRELTAALDEHKRDLERSNDELEQFVYTVSHDLKSPVVTSLGFIGMMRKLAGRGKYEQAMTKLDTLEKANRRMGQLIEDLLDLSRVGRVDMDFKVLDMNVVIANLLDGLSGKLQSAGLSVEVDGDLPGVWGNESRILQVFDNLLSNAAKYAINEAEGSKVVISGIAEADEVRLFVHDNGPGIPETYHDRVFQLFQRLDNKKTGTGIGLAIVAKVMKFHEGRVWIESKGEGDGARFCLAFPASEQTDAQYSTEEQSR